MVEIDDHADSEEQFAAYNGRFMSLFVLFCGPTISDLAAKGTLLIWQECAMVCIYAGVLAERGGFEPPIEVLAPITV